MLVPEWVKKNVFFVGIWDKDRFIPKATGFFVGITYKQFVFPYMVTAEHVVSGLQTRGYDIYCRFNRIDGGVEHLKIDNEYWCFHPNDGSTDVAVCGYIPPDSIDYNFQPLNGKAQAIATADVMKAQELGLGEEVLIVGLFRSHHGAQRNVPIVRIGNLAAMRDEPILTNYCGYIDAYLIEARSIHGLSGSPVMISQAPVRIVDAKMKLARGQQFYLLGLVHGHFDIKNMKEDIVIDANESSGGINTGIGVVVPVESIVETINHPDLVASRDRMVDNLRKRGATPDPPDNMQIVVTRGPKSDGAGSDLADIDESPDANSDHLEDFTRLVDVAARKRPQDDQT